MVTELRATVNSATEVYAAPGGCRRRYCLTCAHLLDGFGPDYWASRTRPSCFPTIRSL